MVSKILFFSLSLIALHTYCMNHELKESVRKATQIKVSTRVKDGIKIPIDDNTTVLEVKQFLAESEGYEVDKQSLYPLSRTLESLGFDKTGDKLTNDQNVKQIMNKYSDRFFLMLSSLKEQNIIEKNEQ